MLISKYIYIYKNISVYMYICEYSIYINREVGILKNTHLITSLTESTTKYRAWTFGIRRCNSILMSRAKLPAPGAVQQGRTIAHQPEELWVMGHYQPWCPHDIPSWTLIFSTTSQILYQPCARAGQKIKKEPVIWDLEKAHLRVSSSEWMAETNSTWLRCQQIVVIGWCSVSMDRIFSQ